MVGPVWAILSGSALSLPPRPRIARNPSSSTEVSALYTEGLAEEFQTRAEFTGSPDLVLRIDCGGGGCGTIAVLTWGWC